MKSNRSHILIAGAIWVVLTAVGEALTFINIYPAVGAEFAKESDFIFTFLMWLSIPVLTFVIAVLVYAMLQWGTQDVDDVGEHIRGTGNVPKVWVGVTSLLTLVIMIYPGLIGVADLREIGTNYGFGPAVEGGRDNPVGVVLNCTAFRWAWSCEYDGTDVTVTGSDDELVLPNHEQIWVRINSTDVLHSFWIPAFRQKIDIVPGRTTELTFETIRLGSFETDAAYRLQCAELCGRDHTFMMMPVRVVEEEEFEAWMAEKSGE